MKRLRNEWTMGWKGEASVALVGRRVRQRSWSALFLVVAVGCAQFGAEAAIQFAEGAQLPILTGSGTDVVVGDVDGDGDLDLVVAVTAGFSRVWINQGRAQSGTTGAFVESDQNLGARSSQGVALADLDGDGDLDAFFVEQADSGANQVWLNQGGAQGGTAGTFAHNGQTIGDDASTAVALGELDGTAGVDAFVARGLRRPDKVWSRSGTDQFTDSGQLLGADDGFDVALGDVDGDGDLDALVGNASTTGGNKLWINQGGAQGGSAGTFADSGQDLLGASVNTTGLALGDLDADGDLDAVFANGIIGEVWLNQGGRQGGARGTFLQKAQALGPNDTAISRKVALGDVDRDGDLDAFIVRFGPAVVFENDGVASFTSSGLRLGAASTRSAAVALGDLDEDGDLDAVVVNASAPVQVWRNESPPAAPTFPEYIITTVAGNGTRGTNGDGGLAIEAELIDPEGIALDAAGNLYIADSSDRVRKVGANGMISTVVGTGRRGILGDGGLATQAELLRPISLAMDGAGNLYIGSSWDRDLNIESHVRKVATNGIISRIIGDPEPGFSAGDGDGGPAADAYLDAVIDIVVDEIGSVYLISGNRVRKVGTDGVIRAAAGRDSPPLPTFVGDGGAATNVTLSFPRELALWDGEFYIADHGYHRVRKVDSAGIITTAAGAAATNFSGREIGGYRGNGGASTNALFEEPTGIAFDSAGNLVVADSGNARIRQVAGGIVGTIAGTGASGFGGDGGAARDAVLSRGAVKALQIDSSDNIYFIDSQRVRKLTPTGVRRGATPRIVSVPGPGSVIDLGTSEAKPMNSVSREIRVGNSGTGDLRIESISFLNADSAISAATHPSLPYTIPDGVNGQSLVITVAAQSDVPVVARATLRIASNDPATPFADFEIRASFGNFDDAFENAILSLFLGPLVTNSPPPEVGSLKASATGPAGNIQRGMLVLDTNAAHQVTAEVPAFLGGGSVVISNFAGSVTVSLSPFPNDAEHAAITVEGGEFVAPSVRLPNGIETGVNRLMFGSTNESGGTLVLSNGNYTAFAAATIRNDLFPEGFRVRGTYSGVFDQGTGRISVESSSTDLFERAPRLEYMRSASDLVLTWMLQAWLETATNVTGPWQRVTNAVSPFSVQGRSLPKEFFRLVQPGP